MDKVWLIIIDEKEEGPYSIRDLKNDPRFTPDTLTKHIKSQYWVQARFIPELKKIFEDEEVDDSPCENGADEWLPSSEIAIDWREPPQIFWLLAVIALLIYTVARFIQLD